MWLVTEKTQPYSKQKDTKKYIKLPEKKEGEIFVEWEVFKIVRDEILYNEKYVFPELFKIIKKDRLFKWDYILRNKLNWDVNKSATVYPLIKSVHDTFVSNLYETEVSARAVARQEDDVDKTLAAQSFRDWASNIWHVQDVKELCRNEASLLGTSYAIGWVKQFYWLVEYRRDGKNYEDKYEEIIPTMEHISVFDLYYNRNATDFYWTQWKAVRKIVSWEDCLERYKSWTSLEWEKKQEEVKRSSHYVSDKDYKRIYDIKNFEEQFCIDIDANKLGNVEQLIAWMDKNLLCADFSDNQNVEVVEYYCKGNLVVLVNGVVIYDDINPLPNKDPFGIVVYERMPWCVRGRGIGHILMAHQEMIDSHQQAADDMIKMHVNPMYIVERWALEMPWGGTPETLTYRPNKTIENKQPWLPNGWVKPMQWVDFQALQLAFQHIERLKQEADVMVGSNSYVQWGQTKVERSSAWVNARLWVVRSRLRPITTSLARLECKMFETWLAAASVLMDEEIKVRVMGEDESISWVDVKPSDIINRFDLECSNETNILETKALKSQEMMWLIQTIIPNNVDPVTQQPIFDVVDLMQQYVKTLPWNIKVKPYVAPQPIEQEQPIQQPLWQPIQQTPTVDNQWRRLPWETDEQLAMRIMWNNPIQ